VLAYCLSSNMPVQPRSSKTGGGRGWRQQKLRAFTETNALSLNPASWSPLVLVDWRRVRVPRISKKHKAWLIQGGIWRELGPRWAPQLTSKGSLMQIHRILSPAHLELCLCWRILSRQSMPVQPRLSKTGGARGLREQKRGSLDTPKGNGRGWDPFTMPKAFIRPFLGSSCSSLGVAMRKEKCRRECSSSELETSHGVGLTPSGLCHAHVEVWQILSEVPDSESEDDACFQWMSNGNDCLSQLFPKYLGTHSL